jgi:hypothetical protein
VTTCGPKFPLLTGCKPYSIGSDKGFSTVIIISHGGFDDPNLAFGDPDPSMSSLDDHQPLALDNNEKSANARVFWQAVGHVLDGCGKIILLGCNEAGLAPKAVTQAARRVYAQPGSCAAGAVDYAMRHVKAIESGLPIPPMQQFNP